ncbi:hypothetical protein LPJ66_005435 [Kickxella alabastrina]|uniref:Uncharacterized protein n=1 Tax=Kickxella alabastrina TaxID=61397 RepID=A0ACC1IF85_9FUNG|nr:hypothetical protein LPJ66_005435 [Kickxella alabastrina]
MSCRIKVTNISKHVDKEILSKLFSFLGQVATLTIRPSVINPEVQEASVDFHDAASAKAALFLSGTELADRALIVASEDPPTITAPITFAHAPAQHPIHPVILPTHAAGTAHAMPLANPAVVAQMAGRPRNLNAIPPLVQALIHPSILQFDPLKAEEISRTVYVGNIAAGVNEQQLMDFFSACGPVAYVKMAGDGMQPTRFAFVEFSEMATAQAALQMNGMMMADRPLKVNHSKNAINKPQRSLGAGLPGVPTLAATASLPSSVDPAAMLAGSAPLSASGGGLAWPVLGTTNPVAADPAGDRIRELQRRMEEKYADRIGLESKHRSPSRESRGTRRLRSPSPSQDRSRSRSRSRRRSSRRDPSEDRYGRSRRRDDDYRRSRRDDAYGRRSTARDYRSRTPERQHRSSRR